MPLIVRFRHVNGGKVNLNNLAILIPCYNEGITIKKVIQDCQKSTKDISGVKIYVYDNNSTDNTVEEARKAGAIVRREYRQGKGNVIRRMFREIDANCYIMLDGDDTYPTDAIPEMMDLVINKNVDMVVGDRLSSSYFNENKRPFHNIGNVLVRGTINRLFKSNIRDILTGYRAFSFQFAKVYPVLAKGFEIETEMSIFAIENNLSVENYIIDYRDRPKGSESKLNTYSDGFKVLRKVFSLYRNYHPYNFYSIVSLLLIIISAAFFLPKVWLPYIHTGMVQNMPTMVVCGFMVVASLILYSAGLVLDLVNQKNKQEFEFKLQQVHTDRLTKEDSTKYD